MSVSIKFLRNVLVKLLKQVYSILKQVVLIFSRNGRWRSVWTIREDGGQVEVTGILKVQVHYYEDGNVQLVSSKEIKETITKSVSIVAVVIWNVLLLLFYSMRVA